MPLSYLNAGPEDVYALNRLGSTFSDMVIGLQLSRQRQQQFMAQQALAQAQLQLEREKERSNELTARETRKKIGAETDELRQRTGLYGAQAQSERDVGAASQLLGRDIEQLQGGDYPENMAMNKALQANVARQAAIIAATHPATIGAQTAQIQTLNDPVLRRLIATGTPAYMNIPRGGSLTSLGEPGGPRLSLQAPYPTTPMDPGLLQARIVDEYLRGAGAQQRGNYGQPTPASELATQKAMEAMGGKFTPTPTKGARVRVKSKDGTIGTIPAEQLDAAKAEGYTVVGE